MTWVIVVVLLLVAFGPVLWLLPSATDKRLARMRARARALGLLVEMTSVKKRDAQPSERVSASGKLKIATVPCAAYRQSFVRPIKHLPAWKLDRSDESSTGPIAGWVWDVPPVGMEDQSFFGDLQTIVQRLPADALALEVTRLDVACYWLESATADSAETAVDSLHSMLSGCAEVVTRLNDRIEARVNREETRD